MSTFIFVYGMVAGAAVALTVQDAWGWRKERAEFRAWAARDREFDAKRRLDAGGM